MIKIEDKHNCCGCSACVQSCPKQCIRFDEDEQGFRYPLVNKDLCIDCGLCEKVCPCLNQNEKKEPLKVFAAKNPNEEIRKKSSSGGIFTMIAESVISEGGVVFGARFDENWEVMHDYTDSIEGLEKFRGSKYLQSRIGETFILARQFLNEGRKVLYSGTGCQIAGLKRFLKKEYDNLLTIEILCHSVPSPLVWRKYLKEKTNENKIDSINFRDKESGWSNYSYSIVINHSGGKYIEPASGPWMKGLTSNLTTRPSCSKCPARFGKSGADIVLGDCWGVWDFLPHMDDDKGTSFVMPISCKGENFFQSLDCRYEEISIKDTIKFNGGLQPSKSESSQRENFFHGIKSSSVVELLFDYTRPSKTSIINKIKNKLNQILSNLILKK